MKKMLLSLALCITVMMSAAFPAVADAASSDLVKIPVDTRVFTDPDLLKVGGVLPAGTIVYVKAFVQSSSGPVLEIAFCHGYIIRTAFVPLMSVSPLTENDMASYAARASEGIVFRPGVVLLNADFLPEASAAAETVAETPAVSGYETAPAALEENGDAAPAGTVSPAPEGIDPGAADGAAGLPSYAAPGADLGHAIVKTADNTAVYRTRDLQSAYGVLPAGSFVYADAVVSGAAGSVLQIVFCQDYIIRTGYIPAASAQSLNEDESSEYASYSAEGLVYRPGVVLMNVTLLPEGTVPAAGNIPAAAAAEGSTVPENPVSDESAADPVRSTAPETPAVAPGSEEHPSDTAGTAPAVPTAASFSEGYACPALVKVIADVTAYRDSALQTPYVTLPSGTVVYAASAAENGAVGIVFCQDYIIRSAYMSAAAALPLNEDEAIEYAAASADGMMFRPGIYLLNISAPSADSSESLPAFPAAETVPAEEPAPAGSEENTVSGEAPSAAGSEEDTAPAGNPSDVEAVSAQAAAAPSSADAGAPVPTASPASPSSEQTASSQSSYVPPFAGDEDYSPSIYIPLGKRYVLNSDKPLPAGTSVASVSLVPSSQGHAEGTVSFAVPKDGIWVITASFPFSADIPAADGTAMTIPTSFVCAEDTWVLLSFTVGCSARFALTPDIDSVLSLFDDIESERLDSVRYLPGYRIDYVMNTD